MFGDLAVIWQHKLIGSFVYDDVDAHHQVDSFPKLRFASWYLYGNIRLQPFSVCFASRFFGSSVAMGFSARSSPI